MRKHLVKIIVGVLGLIMIGSFVVAIVREQRQLADAREERLRNADVCRYITGGEMWASHERLSMACAHQIISEGGTAEDARKQCIGKIDACEKGLAR